jgi:glycosyltransferase involved in cell wall biosynthesis
VVRPIFVSVVIVVENRAKVLPALLGEFGQRLAAMVNDYELIVVDNASSDDTVSVLKELTGVDGLANLQVYGLTRGVDIDTASWAGVENALGDFVVTMEADSSQLDVLPEVLDRACSGYEIVTVRGKALAQRSGLLRGFARSLFSRTYRLLTGFDLASESSPFRVLSRRVINYILQHPMPATKYRFLPTLGFASEHIEFADIAFGRSSGFGQSVDRAVKLLVTTTRLPMRLVTGLCLFGALVNVLYCGYVIIIAIVSSNIAPGWVTMSLQLSGMFFLLSLVLLVLGEYVLQVASFSSEGPAYHVGQEYTSARLTRKDRLNIEER